MYTCVLVGGKYDGERLSFAYACSAIAMPKELSPDKNFYTPPEAILYNFHGINAKGEVEYHLQRST